MATSDAEIKECFKCFDTDNDGKLLVSDIGPVIRALGKAPLQSEVEAMEEEIQGETVDYDTFVKFYQRRMKKPRDLEDDMRRAFKAMDATGSGNITTAELSMLLGTLGEPLMGDELDSLTRCVNVDHEGTLSYDELVDLLVK